MDDDNSENITIRNSSTLEQQDYYVIDSGGADHGSRKASRNSGRVLSNAQSQDNKDY